MRSFNYIAQNWLLDSLPTRPNQIAKYKKIKLPFSKFAPKLKI